MANPLIQIKVRGDQQGKERLISDLREIGKVADDVNKRTSNLFRGAGKSAQGVRHLSSANKEFNQQAKSAAQSAQVFQKQILAQEKAVRSTRNQVVTLNTRMKELGGGRAQGAVRNLSSEFKRYQQVLRGGARSQETFNKAQLRMRDALAKARRSAAKFNKEAGQRGKKSVDRWKLAVEDMTKSVQVALGPLSGVAARITALSALFNKNNAIIAGSIGGLIGFGAALTKVVAAGSTAERDMLRFNALLETTGRQAQITSEELNQMARDFGKETLGAATQAREALSFLLAAEMPVDEFRRILDISQGLVSVQGDIISNTRLVVRALAEPGESLSRLHSRTGAFNEETRDMIKNMAETGDVAGATSEILRRLANFQTLALEEGQGLAGQFDRLTENLTMFFEEAATTSDVTGGVSSALSDVNDEIELLIDNQEVMTSISKTFAGAVRVAGEAVKFLATNIETLASVIGLFVGGKIGIAAISTLSRAASAAKAAATSMSVLSGAALGLTAALKTLMKGFLGPIGLAWGLVEGYKALFGNSKDVSSAIEDSAKSFDSAANAQREYKELTDETAESVGKLAAEERKAFEERLERSIADARNRIAEIEFRSEGSRVEFDGDVPKFVSGVEEGSEDAQKIATIREEMDRYKETLREVKATTDEVIGVNSFFSKNIDFLSTTLEKLEGKWVEGKDEMQKWREAGENVKTSIASIDRLIATLNESGKANTEQGQKQMDTLQGLRDRFVGVQQALANSNPEQEAFNERMQEGRESIVEITKELTTKKRALQEELGLVEKTTDAQKEWNDIISNIPSELRKEFPEIVERLREIHNETTVLAQEKSLQKFSDSATKSLAELREELGLISDKAADIKELDDLIEQLESIEGLEVPDSLADSLEKLSGTENFDIVADRIKEIFKAFKESGGGPQAVETFNKKLEELGITASEAAEEAGKSWEKVGKEIGMTVANHMGDALKEEFGGDGPGAKLMEDIGGQIGEKMGGAIGRVIGEVIGNIVGDFFDDLFGSDNPGVRTFNIQANQPSLSNLDQSRQGPFGGISTGGVWNVDAEEIEEMLDTLVEFDRRIAEIFDPSDYEAITAAFADFNQTFREAGATAEEVMQQRLLTAVRAVEPGFAAIIQQFGELEDQIEVLNSLVFLRDDFPAHLDRMSRSLGASDFRQASIDLEEMNDRVDNLSTAMEQAIASGDPRRIQAAAEQLSQNIMQRYEMEADLVNGLVDRIEELRQKINDLKASIAEVSFAQEQFNSEIDQAIAEMTGGDVTSILRDNISGLREQVTTLRDIEGAGDQALSTVEQLVGAIDQWLQSAIASAQSAAQEQLDALASEREEIMQRGQERAQARGRAAQAAARAEQARRKAMTDALKEQINLLEAWKDLAEDMQERIDDMRLSQTNPLAAQGRFQIATQRVASIRQEFQSATGQDRVEAAERLADAIEDRLGLGKEIFQRPSPEFVSLFNESISEITKLRDIAEREAEDLPNLQERLNQLQDATNNSVRAGNSQRVILSGREQQRLEEIKEEEEQIREDLESKIEELRAEAAEQYEWARGQGNGIYDSQLTDLNTELNAATAELLQNRMRLNNIIRHFNNPQNYLNSRLELARSHLESIDSAIQSFLSAVTGTTSGGGDGGIGVGGGGGRGTPRPGWGFNNGGSFMVGGEPGIDRNIVAFRATRGERVDITPAGETGQAPIVIEDNRTLQFNNVTREDAEFIKRVIRKDADENAAIYERKLKKVRRSSS